ncbi:MAG: putative MoaD/ThiS domain protein [Clostridiales bacterium 38_11]|nr:MAG: putative MoaD/ThiS domain protein [Clostridiales bacterium 38_11]
MISIEIRYFATLRRNGLKKEVLSFKDGISVSKVLSEILIEEKDVAILLVNGIKVSFDKELKDGDIVALFPPVGGG